MLKDYIVPLKEADIDSIRREVAEKGLGNYLLQQLHYLDATKTMSNGMRPEQTISFVYNLDISKYLYVVNKYIKENTEYWLNKLIERHEANLAYEKENPPIVYDARNINKPKRIRKAKEGILPGFEKPKKVKTSKAEAKFAKIKALNISLKLIKPNDTV